MLKLYMNEPFATSHELAQAKRLTDILSSNHTDGTVAWLCFNFSLGGKAIDAAYITSNRFVIIEFKAVGGDVNCGPNIENAQWTWHDSEYGESRVISTLPYANPFSQVKNYRTAVIGELEQRQRGFLKNTTLLKNDTNFAWWVKGCVLLSLRNAEDVGVVSNTISNNARNWFCCGAIGDVCKVMRSLNCSESIAPKEIEKLITRVIGLRPVDRVLETADDHVDVVQEVPPHETSVPATPFNAIEMFKKRYGNNPAEPPKKIVTRAKDNTMCAAKTETVNDFADIDRLLLATDAKTTEDKPEPQNEAGLVVASKKPFRCGFLKLTLVQEMESVASGYGSVVELDGEDAVAVVKKSCPSIGRFEVSKVLRFGDGIPVESKDAVLEYFDHKYAPSPQWNRIVYFAGGLNFIFGKQLPTDVIADATQKPPSAEREINNDFILPRWLRRHIDKTAEGLPPLSIKEVQQTVNLTRDDVQRYASTYLPRSCAEAFVILDWVLGDEKIKSDISVLDVGCGSGGASIGSLLAIHKHSVGNCSVRIDGVDVNDHSLSFAEQIFNVAQNESRGDTIRFNRFKGDISQGFSTGEKYDVVIASKSIGELALLNGVNVYAKTVRLCAGKVTDEGVLLVVDIPKHEIALQEAVADLKKTGFNGWCRRMTIALDGGKDNEDFVCACVTRKVKEK